MEPFHAFLTLKCPTCTTALIRVAHSESQDLVVCPICFTAGGYDEVIEENAALESGHIFSDDVRLLIQQLHAQRLQSAKSG
jgi:hypothetical protein